MSRAPKPVATAKKVPPPAVPHEFRHSGSSFGSAGYASSEDAVFLAPSETSGVPRDDHSDYGSTVSGGAGKSPGPIYPNTTFTFPGQPPPPGGVITHKTAVYYHHQLSLQEDQGIDMTQSPGRDSPGSSSGSAGSGSRHSTASLDSGRASYHPLGGTTGGRSTLGSANSPRCSLSSCSIGSEQGRVERMINQGAPDQEIIHAWLVDLHFEEYFPLFMSAGYDMPTIGRMTPEDLTAIGIKKPNHRKRLKAEIAQLTLPDNLPDYIPGSLEEWLRLLRLEEYLPHLLAQGYQTVDDVTQLTWEDLEDIGIVKLGHQKKIILAIKRVKDIRAGKRFPSVDITRLHTQQDVVVHAPLGPPSPGCPTVHSTFRSFHQPWEIDQTRQLTANTNNNTTTNTSTTGYYQPMYCTDIVPIKIRGGRGKSLESLEDPNERTHHTFSPENTQTFYYQSIGWRPRSYDDGDITPTNESALAYEGGGTLPRPRGLVRPRPVAKISAKTRDTFPDFEKPQFSPEKYGPSVQYKTLPRDFIDPAKYHVQYSPHMSKKLPPSPPKRQLDSCNENQEQTTVEIHQTSSPLPLPAYPSSDSLSITLDGGGDLPLPPPPAPATPPQARMNPSRSWGSSEEQELINALALQHRNGSDASFKSSSSTESDSLPFANENAGTIKTRTGGRPAEYPPMKSRPGMPPHPSPTPVRTNSQSQQQQQQQQRSQRAEPADVLNDIGNMLANLTDELDAMLEEEKRQGLEPTQ
ncbi:caskin [Carabus blaptoides fortunei]